MPLHPSSKLPARELEICARVREVREANQLSMPVFAEELGIARERLASYEYGRAPVRYGLGRRIGQRFDINQRWLATGELPRKYYVDVHSLREDEIPHRALFSEAFDRFLKMFVERRLEEVSKALGVPIENLDRAEINYDFPPMGIPLDEGLNILLTSIVRLELHWLPHELKFDYLKRIARESRKFVEEKSHQIDDLRRASALLKADIKGDENKQLTGDFSGDKPSAMKAGIPSPWEKLLARLKAVAARDGAKTELARYLEVTPAAITQYLSGDSLPAAERTLQLLEWVTAEEAQQKSRGGVDAPTRPKTRSTPPTNEKPRRARQKD